MNEYNANDVTLGEWLAALAGLDSIGDDFNYECDECAEEEDGGWVITPDDLRHLADLAEAAQVTSDLSDELEVEDIEVSVGDRSVVIGQDEDGIYGLVIA